MADDQSPLQRIRRKAHAPAHAPGSFDAVVEKCTLSVMMFSTIDAKEDAGLFVSKRGRFPRFRMVTKRTLLWAAEAPKLLGVQKTEMEQRCQGRGQRK